MDDTQHEPITAAEWLGLVATFSANYGREPLVVMLGSVTGDLTDEARGAAVAIARNYIINVLDHRPLPPLTIVGSPLPTE